MTDAATPDQKTLMRATGHAITLIATMLSGAGVVPLGDFWRKLGTYAAITESTDPEVANVLALWAAMVQDVTGETAFLKASDTPRP